jgi:hypothetical protein
VTRPFEVPQSRFFPNLVPVAEALNAKSDEINTIIAAANDELLGLGIGLTVWLTSEDDALRVRSLPRIEGEVDTANEAASGTIEQIELGYARVNNGWALAIRTAVWSENYNDNYDLLSETPPLALIHAPRELRIAALPRFPALGIALKQAAVEATADIDKAAARTISKCPS